MINGIRIRLFPTQEQEDKLWEHVHAARKVWNWGLNYEMELYKNKEKHLSAKSLKKELTKAKKAEGLSWLNNVSSHTLSMVILDLGEAFDRFFKIKPARYTKAKRNKSARTGKKLTAYDLEGHPKFKSRKDNDFRFPIRYEAVYFTREMCVNIEKIGKVRYQYDTCFIPGKNAFKVSNPRIKYIDNKWILSFGIERENQAPGISPGLAGKSLGIDLGIKTTATVSFGGERRDYPNINKSGRVRRLERKLKHAQRNLSRKYRVNNKRDSNKQYEQTNGVKKTKALKQKIESRITNIRNNYTHQTTRELVSLQPKRIVMEDLSVKNMMKNKHLSKAIQNQKWAEFIRQMKYKSEWRGIEFIQADKYYPSSKRCSSCGAVKKGLKLKDRVYICDECGLTIDRDYNAALNLERYVS